MVKNGRSAIILGAGISGLTTAKTLADQGWSVVILEPGPAAGGNQRSRSIGAYTFDIGSFIFFDDGAFFKLFPAAGKTCEPASMSAKRITPAGRIHDYPISMRDDLLRQSPIAIGRDIASLLYSRLVFRRRTSAGSFARYYLGKRLFDRTGLSNYIARMFGIDADSMDYEFAEKRMDWIARSTSLKAFTSRLLARPGKGVAQPGTVQPGRPVVRPRAGFEILFDSAVGQLRRDGVDVRFDVPIETLGHDGGKATVSSGGVTMTADRVISTLPLNLTATLSGIVPSETLRSVTLLTLYVTFLGDMGFDSGILCNFSREAQWKRLTVHSRAYGMVEGRDYFSVEVPVTSRHCDAQEAFADFVSHMQGVGLLKGDIRLVGHDETLGAYPIYALGASEQSRRLIAEIEAAGVDLIGRQGRFDYLPTSSAAVKDAKRLSMAIAGAHSDRDRHPSASLASTA